MKQFSLKFSFLTLIVCLSISSCVYNYKKKIKGNGIITTQERSINQATKIKCRGNFNVLLQLSNSPSISIQTDENILPYITTEVNEEGFLVINSKKDVNLKPSGSIQVIVNTPMLSFLSVSGMGDLVGKEKFTGASKLELYLSGNGNIALSANTPEIVAKITGTGNINLDGETKDATISITGNGSFKGQDLLTENMKINVTGNGDAFVFASANLDVKVTGNGDVHYKGNPTIKQRFTGNGSLQQIKE